jgi:hypothetical protein
MVSWNGTLFATCWNRLSQVPLVLTKVFRDSINDRLITSGQLSTQRIGQGLLNNITHNDFLLTGQQDRFELRKILKGLSARQLSRTIDCRRLSLQTFR